MELLLVGIKNKVIQVIRFNIKDLFISLQLKHEKETPAA